MTKFKIIEMVMVKNGMIPVNTGNNPFLIQYTTRNGVRNGMMIGGKYLSDNFPEKEKLFIAWSFVSPRDRFDFKRGVEIAISRASFVIIGEKPLMPTRAERFHEVYEPFYRRCLEYFRISTDENWML